jgi:hypothetical protein
MADVTLTSYLAQLEDDEKSLLRRQLNSEHGDFETSWTTALSSTSRTATTFAVEASFKGFRGILLQLANTTTDATLQLTLAALGPVALGSFTIGIGNAFGVSSASERYLLIHPYFDNQDNLSLGGVSYVTDYRRARLLNNFRLAVKHSSANAITYTLKYALIP